MTNRLPAALAVSGALVLGVAACGGGSSSDSGSSSSSASKPKPVAQIDALTGRNTQVALDKGFLSALTKLKVMPARSAPPR
jgi:hypothetical protein